MVTYAKIQTPPKGKYSKMFGSDEIKVNRIEISLQYPVGDLKHRITLAIKGHLHEHLLHFFQFKYLVFFRFSVSLLMGNQI